VIEPPAAMHNFKNIVRKGRFGGFFPGRKIRAVVKNQRGAGYRRRRETQLATAQALLSRLRRSISLITRGKSGGAEMTAVPGRW